MFRILVLVGALAAGGVAAWLSFGLQPGPAPAATVAAQKQMMTQEVLVAAADLAPGAKLTEGDMRWQAWPEGAASPVFVTQKGRPEAIKELAGSIVRQAIVVGEPIVNSKLANKDSGFLAAVLKSGSRAVAVRVSAESSAGGFILPNDHVDVLHTDADDGGRSRTILRNIKVLAIDQTAVKNGTDVAVGKTATLELSPSQAEVISGAQATGALSLALRATADNNEVAPPQPRPSAGIAVRIVRAGQSQTVVTDGPAQ